MGSFFSVKTNYLPKNLLDFMNNKILEHKFEDLKSLTIYINFLAKFIIKQRADHAKQSAYRPECPNPHFAPFKIIPLNKK